MDELDFERDAFKDITERDPRYNARAYTLLMDVVNYLIRERKGASSAAILEEFRERTLDLYGPMSITVLSEWGLTKTEDIGEMMANLVKSGRLRQEKDDQFEDFAGGYDFREAFFGPYDI